MAPDEPNGGNQTAGTGPPNPVSHTVTTRSKTGDKCIGNNLNQIAKWANTHKGAVEAVEVIGHLIAVKRALAALARFENRDRDAP